MTPEERLLRIKQIEEEIDSLDNDIKSKDKNWDFSSTFSIGRMDEYKNYILPEVTKQSLLYRELRQICDYKLNEIKEGWHITIEKFIDNVTGGGLISGDGFGHYATTTHESDVEVYPSDVKYKSLRKDFTHVVWYNN